MRFIIRFKIGNRFGAGSKYSLRDLCICIVDQYSLKEHELATIVTLRVGEIFTNEDFTAKRVA